VNPFTQPVELLDANGNPTGFEIVKEVHIPNPPREIDEFPISLAQITVALPDGKTEVVNLSGPSTVEVLIGLNGQAGDSDGNGLDQVPTEMTKLDLKGVSSVGPVRVTLDPNRKTLGQIEEKVNNTPGILDVPPFAATGTADSYFDVNYLIQVGNNVLHPARPVHMTSVIHHKPPGPGDDYVNPFTEPVELLDASGKPTGIKILKEVHTPVPTPEIDVFPVSLAQITLALPDGSSEVVNLAGPTTVEVSIPPTGQAGDSDGDGLDDVATVMTDLELRGSSSFGPVLVTLDPNKKTIGQIEEKANNTPGILDVPPFAATGTADSFFDVNYEIHIGGRVFHARGPIHMTSVITHKPPAPGDTYVNPFTEPVELLDANGNPTGIKIVKEVHTPNPPKEIDVFTSTVAQITIATPDGKTETIQLAGPTTVEVAIPPNGQAADTDGNGLDQVSTEMTKLDLKGTSSLGPVRVMLDPSAPSLGEIEEIDNNTPGILDVPPFAATGKARSFFDVRYLIQVGDKVFHASEPIRMAAVITHKPPAPGDTYVNPFLIPVELLDANGRPTGIKLIREVHTPAIEPEIDIFPISFAQITLALPNGGSEIVSLAGPTTVEVAIPPGGQARDTDGDGLDQVTTEMTRLDLKGNSSMGPVRVTLDPNRPTVGEIEEVANATPGILDVPPFTAAGTAKSFFDVNYLIEVGGKVYHTAAPTRMEAIITHKPPAPGDTYANPFTEPVELLDADGKPTGIKIVKEIHTPNPPPEVDVFPLSFAQITVNSNGRNEVVNLAGPTTVEVTILPNGGTSDSDSNGLDDSATEMTQLDLTGTSSFGPVRVTLDPNRPTVGRIEETSNRTPGILDIPPFAESGRATSFFTVFYNIQVGDRVFHPAEPIHMETIITHKPPGPGDTYVNPFTQPIELLDANGQPTGIRIIKEIHTPNPPKEIDVFQVSLAQVTFTLPNGQNETVQMSGPTRVVVDVPPNGQAIDHDGNGLEDVNTEMTDLVLTGKSSQGPIVIRLAGQALGEIEETSNKTPGILDVPPFANAGTAKSTFDLPLEILLGGQVFKVAKVVHMETIITHKPPNPRDRYVNPFTEPIDVVDSTGKPTGFKIIREVHIPNPRIVVVPLPNRKLEIHYPTADTGVVLQRAKSLLGPWTDVTPTADDGTERTIIADTTSSPSEFFRYVLKQQ